MHCVNNMVIMQTKQLGWIKTLKEKLHALEGHNQDLEHKLVEQDHIIANLVGDNLNHLQDNMCLTAHINSSSECMTQLEHQLGQVRSVLMGMIEGVIEREGLSEMSELLGSGGSAASGSDLGDQGGAVDNVDVGESTVLRRDSPMPRETGLIEEMEREATEAGLGGC